MTPEKINRVKQFWEESLESVKNKKGFAAYLTGPPSSLSRDKCQIVLYLPKDHDRAWLNVFKQKCFEYRFVVQEENMKDANVASKWLAFYIKCDKDCLTVY